MKKLHNITSHPRPIAVIRSFYDVHTDAKEDQCEDQTLLLSADTRRIPATFTTSPSGTSGTKPHIQYNARVAIWYLKQKFSKFVSLKINKCSTCRRAWSLDMYLCIWLWSLGRTETCSIIHATIISNTFSNTLRITTGKYVIYNYTLMCQGC